MSELSVNGNNPSLEVSLPPFKRTPLRSSVWEHYTKITCEDGSKKARCELCKMLLTQKGNSGTSHLKRHLERCPNRVGKEKVRRRVGGEKFLNLARRNNDQRLLSLATLASDGDNGIVPYSKFDERCSRQELAKMIILHEYPYDMVEHLGFRRFVRSLEPEFKMVTGNTAMGDCLAIFHKEKQSLKELLNRTAGRISLSLKMCTSNQSFGYMSLTAHFIDNDWKLQNVLLNFKVFSMILSDHLENAITDSILLCLLDWNICCKFFSITLDSCCTGDIMSKNLREFLAEKNILPLSGQLFHVPCCTNILDTIVQDELDEMCETIHKVRETVRYVKASHARQQKFDEVAQKLQVPSEKSLCLDVQKQWSSTYLMLEVALDFREVFSCFEVDDQNYRAPSVDDWNNVEAICMFLKFFYNATNLFSVTKHLTSNIYFHEVWKILTQLRQHSMDSGTLVGTIGKRMLQKFEKYWKDCSLLLTAAVVLDPRFKMKLVEYCFSKIYGGDSQKHVKLVHDSIHELYNEYVTHPNLSCMEGVVNNVKAESFCFDRNDALEDYDQFVHEQINSRHKMSELDQYLDEPVFPRSQDFDIFSWWKVNTSKYRILSKIACDILAIPMATSVSSSTFINEGRVLDQYCSSLLPETIEALICAKDWLQNKSDGCELEGGR